MPRLGGTGKKKGGGEKVSGDGAPPPAALLFPFFALAAVRHSAVNEVSGGTSTSQESVVRRRHFPAKAREREPIVPEARHPNNPTRNGVPCGVADAVWRRRAEGTQLFLLVVRRGKTGCVRGIRNGGAAPLGAKAR